MAKVPLYIYILLALFAILQAIFYYPQLPNTVASHFDGSGVANGWSFKETFFLIHFGAIILITGTFLLFPLILRHLPTSIINLPNKKYWLSEERREQTFMFIKGKMCWFGVVNLLLIICTIQLAINANLDPKKGFSSSTMWMVLGAYLICLLIWIITFIVRFRKP
jgi:uncharacterized membrane protein